MAEITFESWLKIIPLVGGVIAFIWGVVQFSIVQHEQAETRLIEARRPFLERQLNLYTEATKAASTLATSSKSVEVETATEKFWALYYGELAMVEDKKVEDAMVRLGKALQAKESATSIRKSSLRLAHACRESLAESWGVQDWRNPHNP